MGEHSSIQWTDHTFNPWIGCTKVGPGCDHCYAEALDKRWYGGEHWGPGAPRRRTTAANWAKVRRWNREAEAGGPRRVFCASLADVFDNEVPPEWRADLFDLIRECRALHWQLVTKRVPNVAKMVPADWPDAFPHVILIATVVNQDEADRDVPRLLVTPAAQRGVSYEPALGPVDFRPWFGAGELDWIIVGGESDQPPARARPFDIEWAGQTIQHCAEVGVPVFVKQLGSNIRRDGQRLITKDRAGGDMAEWPRWLQVRQFPPFEVETFEVKTGEARP